MKYTISNPSMMEPLLFSVDPMSLLLSNNNSDNNNKPLLGFERGPRYGEYAGLRDSKLRMKRDFHKILKEEEERFQIRVSPDKIHHTRFGFKLNPNPNPNPNPPRSSSSLAQSVPDFSAMIRKENRRPVNSNLLPRRRAELTPPPKKSRDASVFNGSASSTRGSVSASAGEKKKKVTRQSFANVEDLKKISIAASSAINGRRGGGGRKSIGGGPTVLGFRQIY